MTKKQKIKTAIVLALLCIPAWTIYEYYQAKQQQEALQAQVLEMMQKRQEAMNTRRQEMQKAFARFD